MKYQVCRNLTPPEYEALKTDIAEHGILVPIDVDEDGEILDGHHRQRAYEELIAEGIDIPSPARIMRRGFSEEEKRNHARRLNLMRRQMTDEERQRMVIDMKDDRMSNRQIADALGVSEPTVRRTLAGASYDAPDRVIGKDGKEYPSRQKPKPPVLIPGDQESLDLTAAKESVLADRKRRQEERREQRQQAYAAPIKSSYLADNVVLGDARQEVSQMPAGVRLLLTDPPYGKSWQSNRREIKSKTPKIQGDSNLKEAVDLFDTVLSQIYPKLADDAFVCAWCDWRNYPAFRSVVEANDCTVRTVIVWDKPNHGSGDLEGAPAPKHEWLIFAAKGNPKLTGDRFDNLQSGKEFLKSDHPALKPLDLCRLIIQSTTLVGDLVVDPFMGVGSSLVAAKQIDRQVWGCEIKADWYVEATKYIADCEGNEAIT